MNVSRFCCIALLLCSGGIASARGEDGPHDGLAALPRTADSTVTPAPGSIIVVSASDDLQSALNNANCGDILKLQAGAVFAGKFTLPAKACDDQHWIIVRTSSPDSALPPEGGRINPCYAGVASLPGRPSFTCPVVENGTLDPLPNVMAQILFTGPGSGPALLLAAGANHYRLQELEVTRALPEHDLRNLIEASGAADRIVFDRMWIHGTATDETKGGIHLSGITHASILNSYFSDFHCIAFGGSCVDSQAINGGTGNLPGGPYRIENNFLEASGESILLGGGPSTTTPEDIYIRDNHLFKPLLWQSGAADFVGGWNGKPFIVKNNLELKNARRVLVEGNVLENVWGGFTQHGFSFVLTPKTQGGVCPLCQVEDVTFRYNWIRHVGGGFLIGNSEVKTGGYASGGGHYNIHDVLVSDVEKDPLSAYGLFVLMASSSATEVLNHVHIGHVTAIPDPESHMLSIDNTSVPMPSFDFENNLVVSSPYPVVSAGGGKANCAYSRVPLTVVELCFSQSVFDGNLLVGAMPEYPPAKWPEGQMFASSVDAVGFVDYAGGDYSLAPSSPYKGAGTDGLDPGADIAGLSAMTASSE